MPTVLTKLAHAHPPDGLEALAAIRASNGTVVAISDDAALDAVPRLGACDGLYLEPSAATIVPAIDELIASGMLGTSEIIVAVACGSGFRESFVMRAARPHRPQAARLHDLAVIVSEALERQDLGAPL
jgi:threonine synthase